MKVQRQFAVARGQLQRAAFERDITAEDLDGIDPYEEIVETKLLQHQRVGHRVDVVALALRRRRRGRDSALFKEIEEAETGDIKYVNIISEEEIEELPEVAFWPMTWVSARHCSASL